jgi:propanol-preferring alcohol dehydrogenase
VLLRVHANAVCRTDLHIVEGELTEPKLPLVPGHQIVGTVEAVGADVDSIAIGDRVGVPWLGGVDGTCPYCRSGRENLCDHPTFTGYQRDGGYAELTAANADFVFPIPEDYPDLQAAPLLCAGLIGYRSLRLAEVEGLGRPGRLGLYGFGTSAHIVIQVARHAGHEVYAYTRGETGRQFALDLGAVWAGSGDDVPPAELDSVIIFAPVGWLVPLALRALRKGGVLACAGIHMSPIPEFDYDLLWGERIIRSVANLTRADGHEFLALAPEVPVRTEIERFALEDANEALLRMKSGDLRGAAVLVP